jgi:hypothetical protein
MESQNYFQTYDLIIPCPNEIGAKKTLRLRVFPIVEESCIFKVLLIVSK